MRENQQKKHLDNPSEPRNKRSNNKRDAEEDSIRSTSNSSEYLEQSDASGKAFYQTPEEFRRDKSSYPQKGDKISVSKTNERDSETDEYRNSKLSDTEMGGE